MRDGDKRYDVSTVEVDFEEAQQISLEKSHKFHLMVSSSVEKLSPIVPSGKTRCSATNK